MSTPWLPTLLLTLLTLMLLGGSVTSAQDDRDRDGGVSRFAALPKPGPGFPEGIAADRDGNVYVATFDFSQPNNIYVFRHNGRLKTTIPLLPGVAPLGLEFSPAGDLYVANFSNGNVLKFVPPFTSSSTPAATFPVCG